MANNPKLNKPEPQPILKLDQQEKPLQKISISHMPLGLYNDLVARADRLGKKIPTYCRIILEHAIESPADYEGPYERDLQKDKGFSPAIHIPIKDKAFMRDLYEWDPYGHRKRTDIALSILRKHLEVRRW